MCPLCQSKDIYPLPLTPDHKIYFLCKVCDLHFLSPEQRLIPTEEKQRYRLHESHAEDIGYRKFVDGLMSLVEKHIPKNGRILDFGAGHQPVLAQWLRDVGYEVTAYDPFFWPEMPEGLFDGVVSCEVIEHFFEPALEFKAMKKWLKPGGHLLAMTDIYKPGIDFINWYYRRDPTHVVFYSEKTMQWIGQNFGFGSTEVMGRVVHFTQVN